MNVKHGITTGLHAASMPDQYAMGDCGAAQGVRGARAAGAVRRRRRRRMTIEIKMMRSLMKNNINYIIGSCAQG